MASDDGIIQVMSDHLANKIAAGEVVQRPASVAKELIENALDAGSSSIEVILKDAGSTLVQVVDDGCGMSPADAAWCFDRHATSKIRSIEDLEHIRTLGFRGEALASIGAVAQVELKTKRVEDDAGTLVRIRGGTEVERRPCATTAGTSIAVRNLFYNVPARRNFLKTPATELKHLTETVQFLALSNPHVAFRLVHNGNEHYDLPAARSDDDQDALRTRIIGLLGDASDESLLPVRLDTPDVSVQGYTGTPSFHRSSRSAQFLFVNERYVRDRYLSHAVKKAYGELLPDRVFPFFALFLDIDPRRVDVNVHPTKAEVKFDDQGGVYGVIRDAVQNALSRATVTPMFDGSAAEDTGGESDDADPAADANEPSDGAGATAGGSSRKSRGSSAPRPFQPRGTGGASSAASSRPSSGGAASSSGSRASSSSTRRSSRSTGRPPGEQTDLLYRPPDEAHDPPSNAEAAADAVENAPIWSLHDRYLLVPVPTGVLLVDPRAAHLRVCYEASLDRLREGSGDTQTLLFPQTIKLPPADVERLEELDATLDALGFVVEPMDPRTVILRGVPAHLTADAENALTGPEEDRRKHVAKTLAQHDALDAGHPLSDAERRRLLRSLFDCDMPYADPSGRPTLTTLSMEELGKRLAGAA